MIILQCHYTTVKTCDNIIIMFMSLDSAIYFENFCLRPYHLFTNYCASLFTNFCFKPSTARVTYEANKTHFVFM